MSGGVNDVQAVVVPSTAGCRRLDGDTPFLLLLHEVGGSCAVVHFTNFVNLTRQLKNAFCRGRFARVHVGKNADVSIACQVFHQFSLSVLFDLSDCQISVHFSTGRST